MHVYVSSLHAATVSITFICLSPSVLQPCYQCFSAFFFSFFCVAFALMSFILATLQSHSMAVSNQIPSDVFVYEENSPICLCVMYINVALYGIYIKAEECWYINKIRAWFPEHFSEQRQAFGEEGFREAKPSDLWDQPVLPLLQSVWRVLKLVWSLWCPLLLGVGSAWRRRTGDALVNPQQYYLLLL